MSESPLENLHIASPCHASWEAMSGDDKARFCKSCQKNVFNLSMMTRQEAEVLIQSREGNLCVRYAQREDGTVVTNDCPVGLKKVKVIAWQSCQRPWRFFVTGVAGIIAALCGAIGISSSSAQPPIDPPSRTQKTLKVVGRIAPAPKTIQAQPVVMGEMPVHSTSSQVPVLMGKPAIPVKQPDNPHVLQGGMAPPSLKCEKPVTVPTKSQKSTDKATPKVKVAAKTFTKKATKRAPLKQSAKKR